MRIFLIVPGGVDKSGRKRIIPVLLSFIERLARNHEVVVIALRQYEQPCHYPLLGAKIVNLGAPVGETRIQRLIRYRRLLSEVVVQYGRPDIIHAFWANDCGLLGGLAGKWWRVPVVLSIGGGELTWLPQISYGDQGSWTSRSRVAWAIRLATVVTGGSRYVCNQLPSRDTVWLPLGIDTDRFSPAPTRKDKQPWQLIQVATLNDVKDQATLLQALVQIREVCPAVNLHLIGLDISNGRLHRLAQQLLLSDVVKFHGRVLNDELAPLYQHAHLYVQSSLHESQGVAVCEAAACGVPTVGTAVGLVAELAPAAATSVPTADAPALSAAILDLLQNPQSLKKLGKAAHAWAEKHDADWTARQFENLYQGVRDA